MNDNKVQHVLKAAMALALGNHSMKGKTAVRRVVGTSEWRHDLERVEAAIAKRERRRARVHGSSS